MLYILLGISFIMGVLVGIFKGFEQILNILSDICWLIFVSYRRFILWILYLTNARYRKAIILWHTADADRKAFNNAYDISTRIYDDVYDKRGDDIGKESKQKLEKWRELDKKSAIAFNLVW